MRLLRRLVDTIDATWRGRRCGFGNRAGLDEEDLRARLAVPVEPTVSELR
jgi:hypothetical protein